MPFKKGKDYQIVKYCPLVCFLCILQKQRSWTQTNGRITRQKWKVS